MANGIRTRSAQMTRGIEPMTYTVNANGIAMHCVLEGPEHTPIVMLCHGLAGNLSMWDSQTRALAASYRVLRFDNRGHGSTEATAPPYSIELFVQDTRCLLDALGIEQVHFVGASLGGMIGQLIAVQSPERLKSLTLVATLSHMPPPEMWDERTRVAREEGLEALVDMFLKRWFTPEFRTRYPGSLEPIAQAVLNTPLDGFLGACAAIKAMNQTALLPRISVPTLVLGADHDPGVPVTETESIHKAIDDSEMLIVSGARHLFCVEQADRFNATLLNFLRRH